MWFYLQASNKYENVVGRRSYKTSYRAHRVLIILVARYMRQGVASYLQQAVCIRRTKKIKKIPPHRKHATKSTAAWRPRPTRDGSRPNTYTRYPILARFLHRSRVCRNQPRLYTYVPALLLLRRLYSFWCSIFSPAQLLLSLL